MAMRVTKPEEEKRTDLIRELLRRHEPVIARAVETAPGYSSISEDLKPCGTVTSHQLKIE